MKVWIHYSIVSIVLLVCSSLYSSILPVLSYDRRPVQNSSAKVDEIDGSKSLKRGIILSSQCSGSGWLVETLNAQTGVIWKNERLIEYSRKKSLWQPHPGSWEQYRSDLEGHLSTEDESIEMIGFKLMYDQIPQHLYAEFADWLYEKQVHVIHLRRKCTALAFASQIGKAQRSKLLGSGQQITHITSKEQAEALPDVPKISFQRNIGIDRVKTLEENQVNFGNYLRATEAPIFEVTYEDLDSKYQAKWFKALMGFMEISMPDKIQKSDMVKTGSKSGSKLCEDRIDGLGDHYESLVGLQSRLECLKFQREERNTSIPEYLFPPREGRCQLTPGCKQGEYMSKLEEQNTSATLERQR
jgi:hypothetical protein